MKTKLLLLAFTLCFSLFTFGQICGTPSFSNESKLQKSTTQKSNNQYLNSSTGLCVNVKFHIVRETNGTGGFNAANLNNILTNLNESYNEHRIYFNSIGHDFIDNSTYYNIDDAGNSTTEFDALVQINNNPNAINIYLVNDAVSYAGRANGILSQALVIENFFATTQVISHEVGHCFNLYHTHRGTWQCESNSSTCAEIDGVNNATCGDEVADTPADPGLLAFNATCSAALNYLVDNNCNYTGGGGFNPDTNNIMSYAPINCLEHFTSGQNTRIRQAFASYSVLQNVISTSCSIPDLTGPSLICNSNTTFSLQNGGSSVSWQVSSNLQILSSNNNQIIVKATNSSVSGNGFIKAILPFETLQKDVWVGKPNINDYTLVWSGPSCIDYNWTTLSFGVQKNSSNGCSLQSLPENITEVEWNIIPSQPINTTMNSGIYSCVTSSVVNAGVSVAFSSQYNPYVTTFLFRVKGSCGWSDWSIGHYYMAQSCNYYSYSVNPNPASETLNIEKLQNKQNSNNGSDLNESESIDSYELYDFYSNLISKGKISNQIKIDVSNYKKGIYILKIVAKGKLETHQIIIK